MADCGWRIEKCGWKNADDKIHAISLIDQTKVTLLKGSSLYYFIIWMEPWTHSDWSKSHVLSEYRT